MTPSRPARGRLPHLPSFIIFPIAVGPVDG
jgi:hypothetical protein